MYSHVFTGMKSFMVVLAVIIILNLSVLGVSGQTTNASLPANGEYGSKCDSTKTNPGDCSDPLACLNNQCDCDHKKRLVWSPNRYACKLKTGQPIDANSACKDSGDCTDYAACVRQSSYVCLGGCYHRPYYYRPIYPHYHRPVYVIHSGGGGGSAPAPVGPPPPPECHCKSGPGSIDGTCTASGALAGKNILPYSMTMLGIVIGLTVMISEKMLC